MTRPSPGSAARRHASRPRASDGPRTPGEAGLVLVSVVLVLALLGLSTGASLWLTRAELWAAGRARADAQARYSAEAGIRHGLALIAPDVDWVAIVARQPWALSDPAAPGPWPIAGGGWSDFPGPPFGYGLEAVSPRDPSARDARLVVRSRATSVRGVASAARASVSRARRPYAPAALVLAGGDVQLEAAALAVATSPRVRIDGNDEGAALGVPSTVKASAASAALSNAGALLDGGVAAGVRTFDQERFAGRSGLWEETPSLLALPVGSEDAPAALRVRGGATPGLRGFGLVLAAGDLEISGDVDFAGVVYVAGRLRLGGVSCRLRGMVWAHSVTFSGPCRIRLDHEAVASADRVLRLPRLPVLSALVRE